MATLTKNQKSTMNITSGMTDVSAAAKRANAKLQRIENTRAANEGRAPINVREQAIAARRAARLAGEYGFAEHLKAVSA